MFDDENLDALERAQLEKACAEAHAAFYPAFQAWSRRLEAGEDLPRSDSWPLTVAVPDTVISAGKCEERREEFAELGKKAALSTHRQGRDAYVELSDDPDEIFGKEMYFWYVRYR
jgi:hypothetical protein